MKYKGLGKNNTFHLICLFPVYSMLLLFILKMNFDMPLWNSSFLSICFPSKLILFRVCF